MVRIYDALIDRLSRDTEEAPSGWIGLVDDEDDQDGFGGRTSARSPLMGSSPIQWIGFI
jgi:hypothetical protein